MLCTAKYEEDDFEGIPELVESINLQATGPTEASRAVRKKALTFTRCDFSSKANRVR